MQALRRRGVAAAALLTLLAAAATIAIVLIFTSGGDEMTPQQATTQIARFVDETLADVSPDSDPVPGSTDGLPGACYSSVGGTADAHHRAYHRLITEIDPTQGDAMVARVDQLWRERGLEITHDTAVPGVTHVFGNGDGGFSYQFSVNRNSREVALSGETPCFSWSEWEEAGIA